MNRQMITLDKSLPTEEKLRIITEELQKRISSGDSKVQKAEDLEKRYPDLPISTYCKKWIKQCTGKSAKEYLVEKRILMDSRELYLSRIDDQAQIPIQSAGFFFEESERYLREKDEISEKIKKLGGLVQGRNHWGGFSFGAPYNFFVVDPDDPSINGEDYKQFNTDVSRTQTTVITIDYLKSQLDQLDWGKQSIMDEFLHESDEEKMKRALDMFVRCVETVEREMDRSHKYNDPCIKDATLGGKTKANPMQLKKADAFFDAIEDWMKAHKMGYDLRTTPEEIKQWASHYYYERVNSGTTDLWGLVGVRCPIAIAVAFINYAAPVADIRFEWAHSKWEWRGDYNSGDLVGLKLTQFNTKEELTHSYYEERGMNDQVVSSKHASDDDEEDDDDGFDDERYELMSEKNREKYWLKFYGSYLDAVPKNGLHNKTFVLSGIYDADLDQVSALITKLGGVIRSIVSGKTDYLLVKPGVCGYGKVRKAIEQQKKRDSIQIMTLKCFLEAAEKELLE